MTREEAIAILQTMEYELSNQVGSTYCRKKYDAVKIAIKALEQIPKLQNRCHALTHGLMCGFCSYECEHKAESEDKE